VCSPSRSPGRAGELVFAGAPRGYGSPVTLFARRTKPLPFPDPPTGPWGNGSPTDSGSVSPSSNLGGPARRSGRKNGRQSRDRTASIAPAGQPVLRMKRVRRSTHCIWGEVGIHLPEWGTYPQPMRATQGRTRITRKPRRSKDEHPEPLPLDPRDPDVLRAKRSNPARSDA
jgi:hypothetical protein